MSELRSRRAWRALEKHYEGPRGPHLRVPSHRYAGRHGRVVSIERFGASAAGAEVLERFGITPEHVSPTPPPGRSNGLARDGAWSPEVDAAPVACGRDGGHDAAAAAVRGALRTGSVRAAADELVVTQP